MVTAKEKEESNKKLKKKMQIADPIWFDLQKKKERIIQSLRDEDFYNVDDDDDDDQIEEGDFENR
ncbi:unnamed protein product [Ilex paraguariensis]|uniref:Uncharacterized protein n=1 Tax=Ilex paraguariensis TaxID=185542 RepID=A0ABC8U340_9AQUA